MREPQNGTPCNCVPTSSKREATAEAAGLHAGARDSQREQERVEMSTWVWPTRGAAGCKGKRCT